MKQTSKKKTVKGMTLVEIIIAMVVFAVSALLLVQIGENINSLHKNSTRLNRKVTIEEPLVVNGNKGIAFAGEDAKAKKVRVTVENPSTGHAVHLNGDAYTTKKSIDGKNAEYASNGNLQFIDIALDKRVTYKKDTNGKLMKDEDGNYVLDDSGNLYSDPDPSLLVDAESPKIEAPAPAEDE